jgi:hypothetical protein
MDRLMRTPALCLSSSAVLAGLLACSSGSAPSTTFPSSSASASPSSSATGSASPSPVPTLSATHYSLPSGYFGAGAAIVGPDNNIWATEYSPGVSAAVAMINMTGVATNYAVPGSASAAGPITVGSDAALWFPIATGNSGQPESMARVSIGGSITSYPLPNTDTSIVSMTSGSDGNIWYVATDVDAGSDSALRAFSPASQSVVANLLLQQGNYGTPTSVISNSADGALVIATGGSQVGLLRVVPSTTPVPSFAYRAPPSDAGSFASLMQAAGAIWSVYTPSASGTGQQLLDINQNTYAVSYTALPVQIWNPGAECAGSSYCPLIFQGPIAMGNDGNLYLWSNVNAASPHGVAVGLAAVSQAGALLAFYDAAGAINGFANEGVVLGPDSRIWTVQSNGNVSGCCITAVTAY